MRAITIRAALVLALCLCAGAAQAQVHGDRGAEGWDLPIEVAGPLLEYLNAPTTLVVRGRTRIPDGSSIESDLAVVGGALTLGGRVAGSVVVIDGDAELLPGAEVGGALTVAGGTIFGAGGARIDGSVSEYPEHLRYRAIGDRFEAVDPAPGPEDDAPPGVLARAEFLIASGRSYNRVEGMPITLGPVLETAGSNPFRLRATAIYRTESGATLEPDALGYQVRAEQEIGGRGRLRVGGGLHSVIDPIEDWHLSNLENSLSTFLFRRDFRDHFERRGWSAFASLRQLRGPWELDLVGVWERHASAAAGSPWTLFRNEDSWRPQPLVGEGRIVTLGAESRYDTRSTAADPAHGWFATGRVERTLDANLVRPAAVVADPLLAGDALERPSERWGGWTHGFADVRRYNRLGPGSRLNLRLLAAGSLGRGTLPPQRQHALGGEGSLPGYSLFRLDCGAREEQVFRAEDVATPTFGQTPAVFHTAYGCDRIALFQAEYRSRLSVRLGWEGGPWGDGDGGGWDLAWLADPEWVVFIDAGQGWARDRRSEDLAANLGAGILFSRVGVYAAAPLSGEGGLHLFVRLGPRF
jgi:hypothetical protein